MISYMLSNASEIFPRHGNREVPRGPARPTRGGLDGAARAMAPAWGAEVVSSNIVGYNKITLAPGYNLLGIQFSQIGGASLDLSDAVILDETYGGYDSNYDFKSTLRVWDPTTEKYITYVQPEINLRPRKTLGYDTPKSKFLLYLHNPVALGC